MDNVGKTRSKGRDFAADAAQSPVEKHAAGSDSIEDPPTRKKGRGFAEAAKTHIAKKDATSAQVEEITARRKGRGFSIAMTGQVGQSAVAAASASAERDTAVRGSVREKKGRASSNAARGPAGQRGAASASLEDTATRKNGRGASNATLGPVGHSGASSASVEDMTVRRKGRGFPNAAVRDSAVQNGALSASVEDTTTSKKGCGSSNAALVGRVGQSGDVSALVESTTINRKGRGFLSAVGSQVEQRRAVAAAERDTVQRGKGHGRVNGSVPSGQKGRGRGDGVGVPNSPKSNNSNNTIDGCISIAAGRRSNGKSGKATKSAKGSDGSAPVKPVFLRGSQKDLAPSEHEGVPVKNERLTEALTPEAKDAEAVAEAPALSGDNFKEDQEEAVRDRGEVAVAAPAITAVMEAREIAVPAGVGHTASVDTACGAEGEERLEGAWVSEEKDAEAVAGAVAAAADEPTVGRAEAVQNSGEVGVQADAVAAPAPAVMAPLEDYVPADDTACGAEDSERLPGALVPQTKDAEAVAEEMAASADEPAVGQAEAVQNGGEVGVQAAAVAAPTPAVMAPLKVNASADVGQSADLETLYVAKGTERMVETFAPAPIEHDGDVIAEAVASPAGDLVAVQEKAALNDGEAALATPPIVEVGEVVVPADVNYSTSVDTAREAEAEDAERLPGALVPQTKDAEAVVEEMVASADEPAVVQAEAVQNGGEVGVHAAAVATPTLAVMEPLEVNASADVGQAADLETLYAAKGTERMAEAFPPAPIEHDADVMAEAAASPVSDLVAVQEKAVLDDGEAAPASPGVMKVGEVAVPADVGHAASVDTARGVEDAERSTGALVPQTKDAEAVVEEMACSADEPAVGQAEAVQNGGDVGVQAAAVATPTPAVMAPLEVNASADRSQAANVETRHAAKGTERMVEAFAPAPIEHDADVIAEAAASPAGDLVAVQEKAVLDDGEAALATPPVVEVGEVAVPADGNHSTSVDTARGAEDAERSTGALVPQTKDAEAAVGEVACSTDEPVVVQAEAVQNGGEIGGQEAAVATPTPAVMAPLEVNASADVGQAADLETLYVAKGTERMVEAFAPAPIEHDDVIMAEAAASPAGDLVAVQVKAALDDGEVAPATPGVVELGEVAVPADVGHAASVDTACGAEDAEHLPGALVPHKKDTEAVAEEMAASADEPAVGQAEAAQNGGEVGVQTPAAGMVRERRERRHAGGWRKRLVPRTGFLTLVIFFGVIGASLFLGFEKPPRCRRKTLLFGDGPRSLKPGDCMASDGGSRWFGWMAGITWKSRLSVSEDGGTYMGPDGTKVPLKNVDWETDFDGGVLCSVERLVRKIAGTDVTKYGVSPRDASPVPGAGLFCRVKETPSTPSVLRLPRGGTARFSKRDDLEVLNSRGKVLWSARDDVDLRRAGEKGGGGKHSPDVSKPKNRKGSRNEERQRKRKGKQKGANAAGTDTFPEAGKGGWGARVWKLWGKDSGGDEHALNKSSGGKGRGIARVVGLVRRLRNG